MRKFIIEEDTVEPIDFGKYAVDKPKMVFESTKSDGFNAIRAAFEKANYVEGSLPDTAMPVSTPIKVIVQPKKVTNPDLSMIPVAKIVECQTGKEYYIQAGVARKAIIVGKTATIVVEPRKKLSKSLDMHSSTPIRMGEVPTPENPHACIDCNNVFFMTDDDEKWYTDKGWPIPKRCKSCREKKADYKGAIIADPTDNSQRLIKHTCISCGTDFHITEVHEKWYVTKNLLVPTRCPKCIAQRKADNKASYTKKK